MLIPDGGPVGWSANLTEALRYQRDKSLYERTPLTSADLKVLARGAEWDPGSFAQGAMDDCYLISGLKALASNDIGQRQLQSMVSVPGDYAVVRFWDGLNRVAVPVSSVFRRGVKRIRGPRISAAAVVESAWATFRLSKRGRFPTMGLSGETLRDLVGVSTFQRRRLLGSKTKDLHLLQRTVDAGLPAVASTIGTNPAEFTDVVDFKKRTFDAVVNASVPGVGTREVQIRAAHAYAITGIDMDSESGSQITIINPWEYNRLRDGTVIRATAGPHAGALTIAGTDFCRLFGHLGLVPTRSRQFWESRLKTSQ